MSEDRPTDLLSALPRTRPHRRSDKRGARPAAAATPQAETRQNRPRRTAASSRSATTGRKPGSTPAAKAAKPLRQPAQPRGIPKARRAQKRKPAPVTGAQIVGTAFQAAGELAELGLALTSRALRNAVSRLPRP